MAITFEKDQPADSLEEILEFHRLAYERKIINKHQLKKWDAEATKAWAEHEKTLALKGV